MDPNQVDKDVQHRFLDTLRKQISYYFVTYIKPPSVLHIFHVIDPGVLNNVDMNRIRAAQAKEGDTEGARLLLDCLFVYKDWFPCLLQVLRHPDVKLGHVAEKFQSDHEKLYKEFFPNSTNTTCPNDDVQRQTSHDGSQHGQPKQDKWMQSQDSSSRDPLDTFTLDDGTSSKPTELEKDSPMMSHESPSSPLALAEREGDTEARENVQADGHKKCPPKPFHGPEYDFTFEETSNALKNLPGWHDETDEKKIEDTLKYRCLDDGYYILWFWARKRRPGVCVTFRKRIKTFIVHKRVKQGEPVQFYIDRKGTCDHDLRRLLSYHLEKGISDMSSRDETTIAFRHPVKELN